MGWRLLTAICCVWLAFAIPEALAQGPFGPAPAPAPQAEPSWTQSIVAQVQAWQSQLYREIATVLRALKEDGSPSALFGLLGIAFMYGVIHAAGPGHGKVVIAAYLAADDSAAKRGVILAFLSSAAQALTAILAVGILGAIVGFFARDITGFAYTLERISFLLIACVGLYLIWRGLRGWLFPGEGHSHEHHHHHGHHHHHHHHAHNAPHEPPAVAQPALAPNEAHSHHVHDHRDHLALPVDKPLLGNWRETAAVIISIGIRPCQGTVFILILALTMGVFWAGVLAAFAVALGTAITVSAIAVLTVVARQTATRLVSLRPAWVIHSARAIAVAAGLLLVWIGIALAVAPPPPLMPGLG